MKYRDPTPQMVTEPAGESKPKPKPKPPAPPSKRRPVPLATPQDVPEPAGPFPKKYAKGGVTRADGCAVKGRTKGRMV
jgi:hypothetical protein